MQNTQHSLFDPAFQAASIPAFIQTVMTQGASLAASISGGKDSDAMLRFLVKLYQSRGWKGEQIALFCDLGRIEWAGVTKDRGLKPCPSRTALPGSEHTPSTHLRGLPQQNSQNSLDSKEPDQVALANRLGHTACWKFP